MRLLNQVSLVTGASRGIGRGIAVAYAKEGSDVIINCSSSVQAAEEVAKEVRSLGRRALVVQADVSNKAEVEGMVSKVIREFGKVDVLVNNAGISVVGPSEDLEEGRWRRGIDVLLTGVFFCCQAVGREMIKRMNGRIINVASMVGIVGFPERACYCSAKAGVINLTQVLACEWAGYNINVNAIAPGYIKTDLIGDLISRGLYDGKALARRAPLGRMGTPEDIASTAVFLASGEASYITGQTICVDGGWNSYTYFESWLEEARKRAGSSVKREK
jgi:NAD(P)-dependent dehydrogenase (short-subunit alcohol dehydrogenase family)